MVLAEVSGLGAALGAAALGAGAAGFVGGTASLTAVATVLAASVALAVTTFTLSTRVLAGVAGLMVPALFVAFVTLAAFAGLATARRLVSDTLRCVEGVVLLRAAWAFWALAVFLFRISTVVVFLSLEFLRAAAALLLEVPARLAVLALF
jgi:hypothetical protein